MYVKCKKGQNEKKASQDIMLAFLDLIQFNNDIRSASFPKVSSNISLFSIFLKLISGVLVTTGNFLLYLPLINFKNSML